MDPIRVLHLTPPGFGGIDTYIFNHYRNMDQKRFRFDFMTQNTELEDAEQYRDFSYRVWTLPATAARDRDGFVKRVQEILRDGYDVLHLHTSYWTGFLIEEIAKDIGIKKVIIHSHSTFVDEINPKKRQNLLTRHEEIKRSFSPDLATDYWACSWEAADWLFGEQIPRKRIKIMKNAIETERFRFNAQKRAEMRRKLGLEDALVLGTVGRLSYQKNPFFLLELFARFHKKNPDSKLLMVGDGELRGELEDQIERGGLKQDVLLLGWKTNVESYLQAMDIFLFPSHFEGLGIAAVEAEASGLPCVVSDQVPEDIVFTENICRVPLRISEWENALEYLAGRSIDRRKGTDIVRSAGYDIQQQAKIMEQLYKK